MALKIDITVIKNQLETSGDVGSAVNALWEKVSNKKND